MNSDTIELLREMAGKFAQLAEAFEREQKATNTRLDYTEQAACETKQVLKDVASVILNKL